MFKHFTPALLLILVGSILVALATFAKSKSFLLPEWDFFIYFFALVAAVGAFWNSYEQNIFQTKIQNQSNKIEALTNSNLEKSEKITELSLEISSSITGGNSIPEISLGSTTLNPNQLHIIISVRGDYPLYDVSLSIQHAGKKKHYPVGNISNHAAKILDYIDLPESQNKLYIAQISSRNGNFTQVLLLEKRRYVSGFESWSIKETNTYSSQDPELKNPIRSYKREENGDNSIIVE
jgi:hypothetical protein